MVVASSGSILQFWLILACSMGVSVESTCRLCGCFQAVQYCNWSGCGLYSIQGTRFFRSNSWSRSDHSWTRYYWFVWQLISSYIINQGIASGSAITGSPCSLMQKVSSHEPVSLGQQWWSSVGKDNPVPIARVPSAPFTLVEMRTSTSKTVDVPIIDIKKQTWSSRTNYLQSVSSFRLQDSYQLLFGTISLFLAMFIWNRQSTNIL